MAHNEGYKYGHGQFISYSSKLSPWEQQGEGGGREERRGEREERKGEREEKERRKEKKKEEEDRKKKEEKEGVLHSEQTRAAKNPELCYKR